MCKDDGVFFVSVVTDTGGEVIFQSLNHILLIRFTDKYYMGFLSEFLINVCHKRIEQCSQIREIFACNIERKCLEILFANLEPRWILMALTNAQCLLENILPGFVVGGTEHDDARCPSNCL